MAWTFIASSQGADGSGVSSATVDCESALNVAAGDALAVWVKHEGATTTLAVADTGGGNAFTFDAGDKQDHSNADLSASFGYILSAAADASFTGRLTLGATRPYRTIQVWQFRPDAGDTVTKDQSIDAQGNGTAINSGNITTTGDDVAVLGGYGEYVANLSSAHQIGGVNATAVLQSQTLNDNFTASWYRLLSAVMTNGAATCTNNTGDWIGSIIAIKSTAAGGRTTKNTRSWELGANVGMGHRM